jgi:hypothetical protein
LPSERLDADVIGNVTVKGAVRQAEAAIGLGNNVGGVVGEKHEASIEAAF